MTGKIAIEPTKLNKEVLDALPLGRIVRDTDVKGLFAVCNQGGIAFKVQHDLKGKTIRMTLNTRDLKIARAEARTIANQIAAGIDPRPGKALANRIGPEAWTLRETMARYIDKPSHREGTRAGIRDSLRNLTSILERRLGSLLKSDMRDAHRRIPSKSVANTTFRYVQAALEYAAKFDDDNRLANNPCDGIEWWPSKAKPFVPFDLRWWSDAVASVPEPRRQYFLLAILSGAREGTLMATEWDFVRPDRIFYPAASMKSDRDFALPLSMPMRAVIASIPRLHAKWVFPTNSACGHMTETAQRQLIDPTTDKAQTSHNLRKHFKSVADALGIPPAHAGALLDHAQVGLDKNYSSRLYLFEALLKHQETISAELIRRGLVLPLALMSHTS